MYSLHALYLADAGSPAAAESATERSTEASAPEISKTSDVQEPEKPLVPFLRVGTVVSGSPAATGGLEEDDLICVFGDAKKGSTVTVSQVVQNAARDGKAVPIRLIRDGVWVNLEVRPGPWNGSGMLGCQVFPM